MESFKNSRLFKNHKTPKITFFWEWTDCGLCFRIYKQTEFSDYYLGIGIQILWLDIWIQLFKKTNN